VHECAPWRLTHVAGCSFHGHGTATCTDGTIYTGEFFAGMIHGKGMLNWVDGVQYEGDVHANQVDVTPLSEASERKLSQISGAGKYTWPDGCAYEGGVCCGLREGFGRFDGPSGQVYEGMWKGGKREGQGTMHFTADRSASYTVHCLSEQHKFTAHSSCRESGSRISDTVSDLRFTSRETTTKENGE
jgi:hypothetical protein